MDVEDNLGLLAPAWCETSWSAASCLNPDGTVRDGPCGFFRGLCNRFDKRERFIVALALAPEPNQTDVLNQFAQAVPGNLRAMVHDIRAMVRAAGYPGVDDPRIAGAPLILLYRRLVGAGLGGLEEGVSGILDWFGPSVEERKSMLMRLPALVGASNTRFAQLDALETLRRESGIFPDNWRLNDLRARLVANEAKIRTLVDEVRAAVAKAIRSGDLRRDQVPVEAGLGLLPALVITAAVASIIVGYFGSDWYRVKRDADRFDNESAARMKRLDEQSRVVIEAARSGKPIPVFPETGGGSGPWPAVGLIGAGLLALAAVGVWRSFRRVA